MSIESAVRKYLSCSATVRRGLYKISEDATKLYLDSYEKIANLLSFKTEDIFFVSSKEELPFEVIEELLDEKVDGVIDISNSLHRAKELDKIYVKGEALCFQGLDIVAIRGLEKLDPIEYGGDMVLKVTKELSTFDEAPFKFSAGTPDIAGIIALGEGASLYSINDNVENLSKLAKDRLDSMGIDYKYYTFSSAFLINNKRVYLENISDIDEFLRRVNG